MSIPYKKPTEKLKNNEYYMYGKHPIFSAINNKNRRIKKIFCIKKVFLEHEKMLKHLDTEVIDNDFITKKISYNSQHQGIIALVETIFLQNISNLNFLPDIDRIVILDQITDPQNIGAIIRSAAAFDITKLILPANNTPKENGTIAKAASGCLEFMQIVQVQNLKSAIDILKKQGFWIAGLDTKGNSDIKNLLEFKKLAIIIGSEGKGMRRLTADSCDLLVKIPISENVESLNASSVASIVFHTLKI